MLLLYFFFPFSVIKFCKLTHICSQWLWIFLLQVDIFMDAAFGAVLVAIRFLDIKLSAQYPVSCMKSNLTAEQILTISASNVRLLYSFFNHCANKKCFWSAYSGIRFQSQNSIFPFVFSEWYVRGLLYVVSVGWKGKRWDKFIIFSNQKYPWVDVCVDIILSQLHCLQARASRQWDKQGDLHCQKSWFSWQNHGLDCSNY